MKRFLILTEMICLWVAHCAISQTPNWTWAESILGPGIDHGLEVATNNKGDIYVVGYFSGTTDFGCTTLTAPDLTNINYFIAKVDSQGSCLWAKQGGGMGNDYGYDIAVDDSGNAYVIGIFPWEANFDSIIVTGTWHNYFLVKYDSTGTIKWLKSNTGWGTNIGKSVFIDTHGNINITGYFEEPLTFDPSGKCLAAGGYFGEEPTDIKTDTHQNVYLTGKFQGTAIFGSDTLISHGGVDGFIVKLDSSLSNVIWAKEIGGPLEDYFLRLDVDTSENVFLLGDFKDTAYFESLQLISLGDFDGVLVKCDAYGNLIWHKTFSGLDMSESKDIELDEEGNIFIAGDFRSSLTVNLDTLISNGYWDMFVAKLDTTGSTIWIKKVGASYSDYIDGLKLDKNKNLIATGEYTDTISFDGITLDASNNGSAFVAKIESTAPTHISNMDGEIRAGIYPNPTSNSFTIAVNDLINATLFIRDITGHILMQQRLTSKATVNVQALHSGMYVVELRDEIGKCVLGKLIKE